MSVDEACNALLSVEQIAGIAEGGDAVGEIERQNLLRGHARLAQDVNHMGMPVDEAGHEELSPGVDFQRSCRRDEAATGGDQLLDAPTRDDERAERPHP